MCVKGVRNLAERDARIPSADAGTVQHLNFSKNLLTFSRLHGWNFMRTEDAVDTKALSRMQSVNTKNGHVIAMPDSVFF